MRTRIRGAKVSDGHSEVLGISRQVHVGHCGEQLERRERPELSSGTTSSFLSLLSPLRAKTCVRAARIDTVTGIGSSMASLVNDAARNSAPVVADDPKMTLTTSLVVGGCLICTLVRFLRVKNRIGSRTEGRDRRKRHRRDSGHDGIIIRTKNQGAVRVLERKIPLNAIEDLEGECWQCVFRQVNPRGTIAGKELQMSLYRLRDVRPAAVHPEQMHLSDSEKTEGDATVEDQAVCVG